MPVACRNRRGFSAEKESHPHYQITGFSRSSGRGISYYGWEAKFILRSSKSHPLRQRAPLCTHSSFPETFVTALTLRSGKNAHTTRLQQFFTYPADEAPIYTKSKNRGDWFQSPRLFSGFFDELLAAFGAADIDAPFSARDTDDLTAARTGEIPVLPVAEPCEKALEGSVFPAARFNVARVDPEHRPDQRHVRQRTECGHPRRKVAAPESAHEHQHNRKNEQPFVKGICSVASVHEPPQRVAKLLKHVTAPCFLLNGLDSLY